MDDFKEYIALARASKVQAWGFTIYRTAYGTTTDVSWQSLLEAIYANVRTEVLARRALWPNPPPFADDKETRDCEEFLSLFKLDVKGDQSVLEGASMDRVREMIKETDPRPTHEDPDDGTLTTMRGAFMYVDAEVLEVTQRSLTDSRRPWVKMVELDYEPDHHKGNERYPRCYFGWMKLFSDSVFEFWEDLQGMEFHELAPSHTDERLLPIWDGVCSSYQMSNTDIMVYP